jgi:hypothetical protein
MRISLQRSDGGGKSEIHTELPTAGVTGGVAGNDGGSGGGMSPFSFRTRSCFAAPAAAVVCDTRTATWSGFSFIFGFNWSISGAVYKKCYRQIKNVKKLVLFSCAGTTKTNWFH